MTGHVATAEIEISAAPSQVWEALTEPELIALYSMGAKVETDWEVGSPIVWKGEYDGKQFEDKGEVRVFEPEKRLTVTHYSPMSGQPDEPESYHEVDYTLEDRGDSVHVVLRQDNNGSEEEAEHSAENWQTMLNGLKDLVESGRQPTQ
jgi:uncharacterized protein YndB with AHSA1/START domain